MNTFDKKLGKGAGGDGNKRRNKLGFPKGRVLDPEDRDHVAGLIGDGPYRRDLLIEYLHKIQDAENCLTAGHLQALASLMRISMAEVYEVASFYDHFDIVKDDAERPAPLTIRVCDSLSCMMAGAEALITGLEAGVDKSKVRVVRAPCMGGCDVAPAARIGDRELAEATVDGLLSRHQVERFDVLCIDTEGYDYEILRLVDLRRYRPEVVLFESNNLSEQDFAAAHRLMAEQGYRLFWENGDTLAVDYPYPPLLWNWHRAKAFWKARRTARKK